MYFTSPYHKLLYSFILIYNFYISLVLFILYLDFVYSESYVCCNFNLDREPQVYQFL